MRTDLKRKAIEVSELHRHMDDAYRREREARATLLRQVVEAVRPAAGALSGQHIGGYVFDQAGVVIGDCRTSKLVLLDSGDLCLLGEEPDNGDWSAELHPVGWEPAALLFDVDAVADRLADLLERQLKGNARKRIAEADLLARKLRAIATLVRDGEKPSGK